MEATTDLQYSPTTSQHIQVGGRVDEVCARLSFTTTHTCHRLTYSPISNTHPLNPSFQQINMSTPTIDPHIISPPVLPLALRAKNDADRLWAEHAFHEPNLLIVPTYLRSRPRTAYHTRIQMELMRNWQLDIARSITSVEAFLFTPEYEYMKERAEVLGGKIRCWKSEVERLEGKIPKVKREAVETKTKAPEVNYGFSKSTVVIPFEKGMKRGAEEEGEGDMTVKKVRVDEGGKGNVEVEVEGEMMVVLVEKVRADSVDVAKEKEKDDEEMGTVEETSPEKLDHE
ncbi:hypothetical protein HBI06_217080 [Parastagonospora nodorum]|nr:hypothetical protein HBI06_217080 [Parastagonospora nodorum]KAH4228953.1 hypothetical protein HBI05_200080 [Parastagonospora nodorum]KAH6450364.1 hypothetical protein HBI57_183140 [Parastagonospora nodorum]KAH6504255.1 hypothetical protein HBI58_027150 [Parastagonospora nodorum]